VLRMDFARCASRVLEVVQDLSITGDFALREYYIHVISTLGDGAERSKSTKSERLRDSIAYVSG
jgi:hypothetical protein